MPRRPNHQGRVTPKSRGTARPEPAKDDAPIGAVGRRPSNPGFLLLVGAMWIVCGIVAFVGLDAGWRLIPTIVFIGVGALFVRGAATTAVRRDSHQ